MVDVSFTKKLLDLLQITMDWECRWVLRPGVDPDGKEGGRDRHDRLPHRRSTDTISGPTTVRSVGETRSQRSGLTLT